MAWTPRPNLKETDYIELPAGWLRCNGQVIPKPSVWAGQRAPDLNSRHRFLRGGTDLSALEEEEHQLEGDKTFNLLIPILARA